MKPSFAATVLVPMALMAGCEQIESPSERTCETIYSDTGVTVRDVLIPGLDDIETVDQYIEFVKRNYGDIASRDEAFRECLGMSAITTSEGEMQDWIRTGVALTGIRLYWERVLEDQAQPESADLEYLVSRDRNMLQRIVGKESAPDAGGRGNH